MSLRRYNYCPNADARTAIKTVRIHATRPSEELLNWWKWTLTNRRRITVTAFHSVPLTAIVTYWLNWRLPDLPTWTEIPRDSLLNLLIGMNCIYKLCNYYKASYIYLKAKYIKKVNIIFLNESCPLRPSFLPALTQHQGFFIPWLDTIWATYQYHISILFFQNLCKSNKTKPLQKISRSATGLRK